MIEYENVRDALNGAFELTKISPITLEGRTASFEDLQEMFEERLCNIADLLGLESLYLSKEEAKWKN